MRRVRVSPLAAAVSPQLVPRLPHFLVFAVFVRFLTNLTPDTASRRKADVETWQQSKQEMSEAMNARETTGGNPRPYLCSIPLSLAYAGFRDVTCVMCGMGASGQEGRVKYTF